MARSKKQEPKAVKCWLVFNSDGVPIDIGLTKDEATGRSDYEKEYGDRVVRGTFTPIPAAGRRKK